MIHKFIPPVATFSPEVLASVRSVLEEAGMPNFGVAYDGSQVHTESSEHPEMLRQVGANLLDVLHPMVNLGPRSLGKTVMRLDVNNQIVKPGHSAAGVRLHEDPFPAVVVTSHPDLTVRMPVQAQVGLRQYLGPRFLRNGDIEAAWDALADRTGNRIHLNYDNMPDEVLRELGFDPLYARAHDAVFLGKFLHSGRINRTDELIDRYIARATYVPAKKSNSGYLSPVYTGSKRVRARGGLFDF
jgi:hypothetical protein